MYNTCNKIYNNNIQQGNRRLHFSGAVHYRHPFPLILMWPVINMMEEDRATDIDNKHKKFSVVLEISSQTDRHTYSSQYFATDPLGKVITSISL